MVSYLLLGDWCRCAGDQEVVIVVIVVTHPLLGDWCRCGGDQEVVIVVTRLMLGV